MTVYGKSHDWSHDPCVHTGISQGAEYITTFTGHQIYVLMVNLQGCQLLNLMHTLLWLIYVNIC